MCLIPAQEQRKHKMSLEHLIASEVKKMFPKQNNKGIWQKVGASLKEIPMTKVETVLSNKMNMESIRLHRVECNKFPCVRGDVDTRLKNK